MHAYGAVFAAPENALLLALFVGADATLVHPVTVFRLAFVDTADVVVSCFNLNHWLTVGTRMITRARVTGVGEWTQIVPAAMRGGGGSFALVSDELTGVEPFLLINAPHHFLFRDPRWTFVQEGEDHSHNAPQQIKCIIAEISTQPTATVVGGKNPVFPVPGSETALSASMVEAVQ